MCGDTSIPASELKDRMATMRQVDPESQIMKIETQFEVRSGDWRYEWWLPLSHNLICMVVFSRERI